MFRLDIVDPILTRKCLEQAKTSQDLPLLTFPLPSSPGDIISFINSDKGQIFIDNANAIFDRLKTWAIQQKLNAGALDDINQRFTRAAVNKRTGFNDFFELCTKGLRYFNGINTRLAEEHRSLVYKKHIVSELLVAVKGKCEDGINTYAKNACDLLSADPSILLTNVKRHIAEQAANLTLVEYQLGGNQIHYANALMNHFHDQLGIDPTFDTLAAVGMGDHVFSVFVENFKACMTADKFITELAVQFDLALMEEALKKAVAEQSDVAKIIKDFERRLDILGCDSLFKMLQLFDQDKLADDEYVFGFGADKMLRATLIERLCSSGYLSLMRNAEMGEVGKISYYHALIGDTFYHALIDDAFIILLTKQGEKKRVPLLCALLVEDDNISLPDLFAIVFSFAHPPSLSEINESPELILKLIDKLSSNKQLASSFNLHLANVSRRKIYTNIFIELAKKGLLWQNTLVLVTAGALCVPGYNKAELFSRRFDALMSGPIKLDLGALFSIFTSFPSIVELLQLIQPKVLIRYFATLSDLVSFLMVFPKEHRFEVYNLFRDVINPKEKGFEYEEKANALIKFLQEVIVDPNQLTAFISSNENVHIWATKMGKKELLFDLLKAIPSTYAFHCNFRAKLYVNFVVNGDHFSLYDLDKLEELTLSNFHEDKSGEEEKMIKIKIIQMFLLLDWPELISSKDSKLFFERYFSCVEYYQSIVPFNLPDFKTAWQRIGLIPILKMASQLPGDRGKSVISLVVGKLTRSDLCQAVDTDSEIDLSEIKVDLLARIVYTRKDLISSVIFASYPPSFIVSLCKYVCKKINFEFDIAKLKYEENSGIEKYIYFAVCELPDALSRSENELSRSSKFFVKPISLAEINAAIKMFLNACGFSFSITENEKLQIQRGSLREVVNAVEGEKPRGDAATARL